MRVMWEREMGLSSWDSLVTIYNTFRLRADSGSRFTGARFGAKADASAPYGKEMVQKGLAVMGLVATRSLVVS